MPFSWNTARRPMVALAPMAGVTDGSYRQIIKMVAPETIVYTEFLSTDAISFGSEKTIKMMEFDPQIERPFIVQVFGSDPKKFIESCKVIEQTGADGIDINMGCPAAKIVSSCYGSALLRHPGLAAELVAAAVSAVRIPVSVKTRLGWESPDELIPFCKGLEAAGAAALAIHGRTYKQKFTGTANWEPIYALKKELKIPVLGNGDIGSPEDAAKKLRNLDGVMVGRGTYGNPWVMQEIADALSGAGSGERLPAGQAGVAGSSDPMQKFQSRIPFILKHCELSVKHKGERRGVLEMRRHLAGYVKGFDGAKELRMKLMALEKLDDVREQLHNAAVSS
ncbi:MAG: tRNA-dihydrouridine synthase [Candidatus Peribacteraceae bacterium]